MTFNLFSSIILAALVLEFVFDVVADLLNLRALKLELPSALEGVYKPDEYRNSQEYTRATTRFGFVTSTFRLLLLLCFWFTGGFNYLDQVVRAWGYVSIVNGLLYIGILLISYNLLMLPFAVYATFVIEERFGFNRTTPSIFVMDRVKGLAFCLFYSYRTHLQLWNLGNGVKSRAGKHIGRAFSKMEGHRDYARW